ncbi:uncharacterized protein LOC132277011 [Cornus florida]|uniref:uncharacterized protein LOC132277011 n=1 Tax=Cornus florida TaxID=4283 RepID=UPI00289E6DDC|nr:uncharacterized protein LOC132277011 [Cornus florida]
MMKSFDSPLEALAFNYVSFGFLTVVNNIWTWIAVITAAVSFWRIKASGSSISDPPCPNPDVGPPKAASPLPPTAAEPSPAPAPLTTMTPWVRHVESDGATRGNKFTLYYEEEQCERGDEGVTLTREYDDGSDGVVKGGGGAWCDDGWEGMLRMRMGDMGLYRLQDLTVLDGNVVRLWDGCRRKQCRLW